MNHKRRQTFRAVCVLQTEAGFVTLRDLRAVQGQEVIVCEDLNTVIMSVREDQKQPSCDTALASHWVVTRHMTAPPPAGRELKLTTESRPQPSERN